jgi:hypothetical protein
MTETTIGAARKSPSGHPNIPPFPARDKQSLIQWTTEQQIQQVSKKLAGIS